MRSKVLVLRRLNINWLADFEGSGPTATAIEFMEKTLQKLNERVAVLSMGAYPGKIKLWMNFTTRKGYDL